MLTQAMIFCAGLGTRFKPWTDSHPKALAMVNGKSLLQRNVEYLLQYGIDDIIVNIHHFPDQIREAIAASDGWGANVSISDESSSVLETGGGLIYAQHLFHKNEDLLTINADILTNMDLAGFYTKHQDREALVSLAVTGRESGRCFVFDASDRLCGWRNLKTGEERMPVSSAIQINKAFSGISIFSPAYFEKESRTGKFSLVDSFLGLAAENVILGYDHDGDKWVDVGRPESVEVAESLFK